MAAFVILVLTPGVVFAERRPTNLQVVNLPCNSDGLITGEKFTWTNPNELTYQDGDWVYTFKETWIHVFRPDEFVDKPVTSGVIITYPFIHAKTYSVWVESVYYHSNAKVTYHSDTKYFPATCTKSPTPTPVIITPDCTTAADCSSACQTGSCIGGICKNYVNKAAGTSCGTGKTCNGSGTCTTTQTNTQPVGTTDEVNSSTCSVRGWAYDPDASGTSIDIHVYRDGQAGIGVGQPGYKANVSRPDVNSAFLITGNHGFDIKFSPSGGTMESGLFDGKAHTIYVYAIDTAGGTNPLLGMTNGISRTITCSSSSPPSTSKGSIQGYKVLMPGNNGGGGCDPLKGGTGCNQPWNATVSVDGGNGDTENPYGTGQPLVQPYWNSLSAGNHTVSVNAPTSGFTIGYTLCYNATNCHNNTPTPGNSVVVNVPDGGYADLWWHYTPPSQPADINRDGIVDLIDFNLWLRAFQEVDIPPYTAGGKAYYPDVNSDSTVDLLDFNLWLSAFKSQ